MSRQSDDMTADARLKFQSIGRAIIWVGVSAIVTYCVTDWIKGYKEVKQTAMEATFMTVDDATKIHSKMIEERKAEINDTRNTEARHYEETTRKLDKIQDTQIQMLMQTNYIVKAIKGTP